MRIRATLISAIKSGRRLASSLVSVFADDTPGLHLQIEEAIKANEAAGVWGVASGWTAGQLAACQAFQDPVGTIPVYSMEQPLGLLLDTSGRGNHAYNQASSTNRPTVSRRVNLLASTEDLSTSAWHKGGATTTTAGVLTLPKLSESLTQSAITTATPGTTAVFSVELSGTPGTLVSIGLARSSGGVYEYTVNRITLTGTPTRYSVVHTIVNSGQLGFVVFVTRNGATDTATSVNVSKADLRLASDAIASMPAYQRVTSPTDYDEVGFPAYASFDGLDDWMETGKIDMTSTDEVTVVASLMRLSDSASAALVESGTATSTVAGTFAIFSPSSSGSTYSFRSVGSTFGQITTSPASYPAPHKGVVSGVGKIGADTALLRVNGTEVANSPTDQGAGNYSKQKLYIGRRAGSSLPFKGRLYGLTIVGKLLPDNQLLMLESKHRNTGKLYL